MIRLHSISMSRFRGVREGVVQGLADVNLLVGRNNSGKTTVLEAIMRVLMTARGVPQDVLGRPLQQIWGPIRGETGQVSSELWYRQDQTQPILLKASLGESKAPSLGYHLTFALKYDQGNVSVDPPQAVGLTVNQVAKFSSNVTLFRPLDALNRNIESQFWPALLSNRRDKALTKTLNEIFSLKAEGFQLLPDKRLIVLFEDYSLPLDVQGDGTRAAVRTMMVLAMLRQALFMLEEPECHQHPGSLERFALALCRSAREQEVQLLISTHSAECVRAFLKAAAAAGSEGAVFHLTLTDGKQEARRLDAEAVETLQSTGLDVRFLDLYG